MRIHRIVVELEVFGDNVVEIQCFGSGSSPMIEISPITPPNNPFEALKQESSGRSCVNDGFASSINIAKTIALDMDVEPTFPLRRHTPASLPDRYLDACSPASFSILLDAFDSGGASTSPSMLSGHRFYSLKSETHGSNLDLVIWNTTRTRHEFSVFVFDKFVFRVYSFRHELRNSCFVFILVFNRVYSCLFVFIRVTRLKSCRVTCYTNLVRVVSVFHRPDTNYNSCRVRVWQIRNSCRVNSCLTRIHDTVTRIARSTLILSIDCGSHKNPQFLEFHYTSDQNCMSAFRGPLVPNTTLGCFSGSDYSEASTFIITFPVSNMIDKESNETKRAITWEKYFIKLVQVIIRGNLDYLLGI
ncbi:hypothetical protein LXL04_016164 [Taraxacum kok-saghyz]